MKSSVLSRSAADARVAAVNGRTFLFIILLLSLAAHRSGAQTFPTPAPTFQCPTEIFDVVSCLNQYNVNATECGQCQNTYRDSITDDTTCTELSALICNQINACETVCGSCSSQSEQYLGCLWADVCVVSCSSVPTTPTAPNPAPAPAPSPISVPTSPTSPTSTECASEIAAYQSCVAATGDAQACSSCLTSNFPDSGTCAEVEQQVCATASVCPDCGSCEDESIALVSCRNAAICEAFTCSPTPTAVTSPAAAPVSSVTTEGPTPLQCPDERTAFTTCISSGGNTDSCSSCILSSLPDASACSEYADFSCSAMDTCPMCGSCGSELVSLMNCISDGVCQAFTCPTPGSTSSPVANPSPVSTSPGLSPTDDRCISELDDLQDCLATAVSAAEASRCEICVTNAFDGLFPTAESRQAPPSCVTVNNNLCEAVFGTCDCGTCGDEYQLYLTCQVDALTTGCELDCGGTPDAQTTSASNCLASSFGLSTLLVGIFSAVVSSSM